MLYGRERELRVLRGVVQAVAASDGRAVALVGEPGVGKTALLDACAQEAGATGVRVLRAQAAESEAVLPYAILGRLLSPLLGTSATCLPPNGARCSTRSASRSGPAAHPAAVAAAAFNLLGLVATEEPLLLVADDAHWIDPASGMALGFVAGRLVDQALGVLLASRAGEAYTGLPHAEELRIDGLGDADARRLLREQAERPIAEPVVEELVAFANGNPLALLEAPAVLSDAQLAGTEPLPRPMEPGEATRAAFRWRIEGHAEPDTDGAGLGRCRRLRRRDP